MPKTVLLVDDNTELRTVLAARLRRRGFEILEAGTGAEAIKKAISEKPHVILVDLHLPDITGPYVARILKNHPDTAAIPIVGWTGFIGREHKEAALSAGMVDCLVKPLSLETIAKKLDEFIFFER